MTNAPPASEGSMRLSPPPPFTRSAEREPVSTSTSTAQGRPDDGSRHGGAWIRYAQRRRGLKSGRPRAAAASLPAPAPAQLARRSFTTPELLRAGIDDSPWAEGRRRKLV